MIQNCITSTVSNLALSHITIHQKFVSQYSCIFDINDGFPQNFWVCLWWIFMQHFVSCLYSSFSTDIKQKARYTFYAVTILLFYIMTFYLNNGWIFFFFCRPVTTQGYWPSIKLETKVVITSTTCFNIKKPIILPWLHLCVSYDFHSYFHTQH